MLTQIQGVDGGEEGQTAEKGERVQKEEITTKEERGGTS